MSDPREGQGELSSHSIGIEPTEQSETVKTMAGEISAAYLDEVFSLREQLARAKDYGQKAEADLREVSKHLERISTERPLAVAILDGDGMIFDPKYLAKGEEGGKAAASELYRGLMSHLNDILDGVSPALIIFIFLAKHNLMRSLTNADKCTMPQFHGFMKGLVQSHPLMNVVDVEAGKERADDKLKSHFWLFLQNFQTRIVFFGGCHDGGYAGTLQEAQTVGLQEKIVLLRGYSQEPVQEDIEKLQLLMVEIPGLFIPEKVLPYHQQRQAELPPTPALSNVSPLLSSPNLHSNKSPRKKSRNLPVQRIQIKDVCWSFYLRGECLDPASCRREHNVQLSPAQLQELREHLARLPCKHANKGKCNDIKCIYGHKCPNGPSCSKDKCPFIGQTMHDGELQGIDE